MWRRQRCRLRTDDLWAGVSGSVVGRRTAGGGWIHFYHLWKMTAGAWTHLDTEHVAVLVSASERDVTAAKWKAVYWYAAAHENTVWSEQDCARVNGWRCCEAGEGLVSRGNMFYLNERSVGVDVAQTSAWICVAPAAGGSGPIW